MITLDTLERDLERRLAGWLYRQRQVREQTGAKVSREDLEASALVVFSNAWSVACHRLPKPRTGAENVARVRNLGHVREQLATELAGAFASFADPADWPAAAGAVVRRHVVGKR